MTETEERIEKEEMNERGETTVIGGTEMTASEGDDTTAERRNQNGSQVSKCAALSLCSACQLYLQCKKNKLTSLYSWSNISA